MRYEEIKAQILDDFSVSDTLKNTIKSFDNRDVLDALKDAELLVQLMNLKFKELTGGIFK